jgi:anaerobic dimethyl sulfoxide reductase subunit B (iron-sulfur subunit)
MAPTGPEYVIHFDPEKCTQCHGCEIACKTWRGLDFGIRYRRVLNLWRARYPQGASASLSLACLHCVDPPCAAACPEEAISKDPADGQVRVDSGRCMGCELCREACPYGVPQFGAAGAAGIMEKCDLCFPPAISDAPPPCVDTCPGRALSLRRLTRKEKIAHQAAIRHLLSAVNSDSL